MPPLRERGDDVYLLAREFLSRSSKAENKLITGFTSRAERHLMQYRWPGNVLELQNVIGRAVALCTASLLDEPELYLGREEEPPPEARTLAQIEREAILGTLEAVDWSTTKAAEILQVSVRTIQYRLNAYGISARRRGKSTQ
jgi:two-component system response regulator HydG